MQCQSGTTLDNGAHGSAKLKSSPWSVAAIFLSCEMEVVFWQFLQEVVVITGISSHTFHYCRAFPSLYPEDTKVKLWLCHFMLKSLRDTNSREWSQMRALCSQIQMLYYLRELAICICCKAGKQRSGFQG